MGTPSLLLRSPHPLPPERRDKNRDPEPSFPPTPSALQPHVPTPRTGGRTPLRPANDVVKYPLCRFCVLDSPIARRLDPSGLSLPREGRSLPRMPPTTGTNRSASVPRCVPHRSTRCDWCPARLSRAERRRARACGFLHGVLPGTVPISVGPLRCVWRVEGPGQRGVVTHQRQRLPAPYMGGTLPCSPCGGHGGIRFPYRSGVAVNQEAPGPIPGESGPHERALAQFTRDCGGVSHREDHFCGD